MWRVNAAAVCLATFLLAVSAGDDGEEEGNPACKALSVSSFDSYIAAQQDSERYTLVMFHVGWCKVCQRLYPEFKAAAGSLARKHLDLPLNFAHVDCEKDKLVCSGFELTGYPSFKLFELDPASEPRSYKGVRSHHGFVKYAERMTQPPVVRLATGRKDFDKMALDDQFAAFAVEVPEGEDVPAALRDAATALMDRHKFAAVPALRGVVAEAIEVPPGARMAAVVRGVLQWPSGGRDNPHKTPPVAAFFTGHLDDSDEVTAWLNLNLFPGVWTISDRNFFDITHADRSVVVVAVDPQKLRPEDEAAIRSAAAALADDFIFGVINGVDFSESLVDFGISKEELPRVIVTESNFEFWVEDAQALTVARLEMDLRELLAGALLQRHGRNVWTKLLLYKRRSFRYALQLREYAGNGPKETSFVVIGVVTAFFVFFVAGKLMMMLCGALAGDSDEGPAPVPSFNGFSGYWRTEHGKGKLEHITNGRLRGVDSYTELDACRCCALIEGKNFTGTLSDDCTRLHWSDGDVWHREGKFEREWASAAARKGQKIPRRDDPLKRD